MLSDVNPTPMDWEADAAGVREEEDAELLTMDWKGIRNGFCVVFGLACFAWAVSLVFDQIAGWGR